MNKPSLHLLELIQDVSKPDDDDTNEHIILSMTPGHISFIKKVPMIVEDDIVSFFVQRINPGLPYTERDLRLIDFLMKEGWFDPDASL